MSETFIYKQLELVSLFGTNFYFALVILILIAIYLGIRKHYIQACITVLTIFSFPYSLVLKGLFRQARPLSAVITDNFILNNYSFPSTHVVFYTVFFGYMLFLSYTVLMNKFVAYFIRLFSIYFLFLVGISRVYLGMHWTADVLAGYYFGGLLLALYIYLDKTLTKKQHQNHKSH